MSVIFSDEPFVNELDTVYAVEPLPKEVDTRGYIYLVKDKVFPDFIKIGRTGNMHKRLAAYATDKPYPTTYLVCISGMFKDAVEVEARILAEMYKQAQPTTFRKEWFKLEHEQLCLDLIDAAEEHFELLVSS